MLKNLNVQLIVPHSRNHQEIVFGSLQDTAIKIRRSEYMQQQRNISTMVVDKIRATTEFGITGMYHCGMELRRVLLLEADEMRSKQQTKVVAMR